MAAFISERFGEPMTDEELLKLSREAIETEREFNRRAGFDREDDRLPQWLREEPLPLPDGPSVFDIEDAMLDEVWG